MLNLSRVVILAVLLLLAMIVLPSFCEVVHYYTYEEEVPGTVIAVLSDHSMFNSTDRPASNFRLMKQFNSSFIHVGESDGQLSIGERIDREQICKQSLHCILALDVVSFSKEQFKLIHVEVEVRDINDNSPHFPSAEIPVEVSESASVGTRIPLEIAVDEDVGSNSIQSFQISVNSHFSIDVQTRADGVKYADLVLMKELDRENLSSYTLELVAMDGGSPPRSGSAVVNVRVMDFNDNSPVFEQSAVTVDLMEDAPVGYLLLDLNAVDTDEGVNGEIVYGFSTQVSQEVRQLFKIDPKSGRLTLEGQVDFETKQTYEFDVQAQDLGPNPLTSTCKIIVHIIDVNDNAPAITITPLTSISAGVAYITEAAAKESFVALISTTDRDSGANGQVHCTLYGHEHFKLQQAYEDSFMIVTTSALDREKIAEYNLTVVAEDLGSPSFKTINQYTIRVSDENDNTPVFAKPAYEVSVLENNAPGAYITTVIARDPDLGHNGKVIYRLVETEVMGEAVSRFVAVATDSGVLYAVRSFDYEKLKQLDLEIEAIDNGVPELTTRAQIRIKIVDQNDNAPVITSPLPSNGSVEIMLPTSAPQNYLVFQVKAVDEDEGLNSQLFYTILRDAHRLFAMNRATGEVSLRRRVNSLKVENLSIVIGVYDSGRPSLFCNASIQMILTNSTPSTVEIVIMQTSAEEQQQLDLSIVFIAVLSGGCGLLLIAIIFVASTCKRKSDQFKREPEGQGRCREDRLLNNTTPAKSTSSNSSVSQSDSCQLSINTESDDCSKSSVSEECRNSEALQKKKGDLHTSSNGSVSVPSYHTSSWNEEKSSISISGNSRLDQFSAKDSGKGDSDFNDSDSDACGEGRKKRGDQAIQKQPGSSFVDESKAHRNAESSFNHRSQKNPISGNFTMQYGKGYTSYSLAPSYHNTYHPRIPNIHIQHHNLTDTYYQVSIPKTERMQGEYERVLVNRVGTLSPPRLSRQYQELNYYPQMSLGTHPSEIATTF
ncbi:protocadherin-8-like [Ascaphus truei]|uniref:protocadherin-8-like n=1 Tax=Ascaphus truei TaxID=8439 RepID=UPI003F5AA49D